MTSWQICGDHLYAIMTDDVMQLMEHMKYTANNRLMTTVTVPFISFHCFNIRTLWAGSPFQGLPNQSHESRGRHYGDLLGQVVSDLCPPLVLWDSSVHFPAAKHRCVSTGLLVIFGKASVKNWESIRKELEGKSPGAVSKRHVFKGSYLETS